MIPKLPALALGLVLVAATACADPSTDARECIRVDGLAVTVALEIDGAEEERIRRYLESAGSDADRSELIEGAFWQSSYQDGCRSLAMVELLSGLREMIAEGRELNVVLLDREGFPSAQARDARMAERIVEVAHAAPEDVVLSLTGDIHSRVAPGPVRRHARGFGSRGRLIEHVVPASSDGHRHSDQRRCPGRWEMG